MLNYIAPCNIASIDDACQSYVYLRANRPSKSDKLAFMFYELKIHAIKCQLDKLGIAYDNSTFKL